MNWIRTVTIVGLVAALLQTLPAGAAPSGVQTHSAYQLLPGGNVPGTPETLNRVAFERHWVGGAAPDSPAAVLILIPGMLGGAEDFRYVGERLVTRNPWLQVWAVDRRNNLLENRCGMERAQQVGNPRIAIAYYLGGQTLPGCPPQADPDPARWNGPAREFALSQQEAVSLGMARWGFAADLPDLRRLITFAHWLYPSVKVFLGGHSLGGMTAQIYAGWRFGETADTAGWRTIDGLVLIDGGVDGPNWNPGLIGQYFAEQALIEAGIVYWDNPAIGATPLVGLFAEIAGQASTVAPTAESYLWPILPPPFGWPDPMTCPTNKALLAAFSDETGPFSDFRMHQGAPLVPVDFDGDGYPDMCAAPNNGRFLLHWRDFDQVVPPELASSDVFARALWESRTTNAVEWYFSIKRNADIDLASNVDSRERFVNPVTGKMTTAEKLEGHRVFDTARVALPVYAFAGAECRDRFEWYGTVATRLRSFTLIDHSAEGCPAPSPVPYAHLDPLFASDTGPFVNAFVASVSDWLGVHR